jgi:hypothetical protein
MYTFSITWLLIGILIIALGVVILRYYNKFAENTGVGNYSRWQLAGIIVIALGFIMMFNLHTLIISFIVGLVVPGSV